MFVKTGKKRNKDLIDDKEKDLCPTCKMGIVVKEAKEAGKKVREYSCKHKYELSVSDDVELNDDVRVEAEKKRNRRILNNSFLPPEWEG